MLTIQQILSFAPDAGTAQRGQDLATMRKWRGLEGNEKVIWGECRSSGASYYKTAIDLQGPAFKCTCPSRKFPCKHAVGLMLMLVQNSDAFRITTDVQDWVQEWLEKRASRSSTPQDEAAEQEAAQKRTAQKNKNRSKRMLQMEAGLEDLETWLMDTIRQGLASTERQGYDFWHDISARMVDAKLGGIGKRIKNLQLLQGGKTDWVDKMLSELASFYLVAKGFKNLENLPVPLQYELLSVAGINTKKDEVFELAGIVDDWLVVGQLEGIEDNLNFRRVWLQGKKTQKFALILDYSFGDAGFPNSYITGSVLDGEIVFYPRALPLRALVKLPVDILQKPSALSGFQDFQEFSEAFSKALFANPWLVNFPTCFEDVIPVLKKDRIFLVDKNKKQIEVFNKNQTLWKLLALSGGHPIHIFGEWNGELFLPLSAQVNGRLVVFE